MAAYMRAANTTVAHTLVEHRLIAHTQAVHKLAEHMPCGTQEHASTQAQRRQFCHDVPRGGGNAARKLIRTKQTWPKPEQRSLAVNTWSSFHLFYVSMVTIFSATD